MKTVIVIPIILIAILSGCTGTESPEPYYPTTQDFADLGFAINTIIDTPDQGKMYWLTAPTFHPDADIKAIKIIISVQSDPDAAHADFLAKLDAIQQSGPEGLTEESGILYCQESVYFSHPEQPIYIMLFRCNRYTGQIEMYTEMASQGSAIEIANMIQTKTL